MAGFTAVILVYMSDSFLDVRCDTYGLRQGLPVVPKLNRGLHEIIAISLGPADS